MSEVTTVRIKRHLVVWQNLQRCCGQVGDKHWTYVSVIEKEVQAEISKAQASPDQFQHHIRSAFMNVVALGARLQTRLPDATTDKDGWCAMVERVTPSASRARKSVG
jgi:hypothetical protein